MPFILEEIVDTLRYDFSHVLDFQQLSDIGLFDIVNVAEMLCYLFGRRFSYISDAQGEENVVK